MAPMVETDILSNLPEDLKEIILTYLPIKEAGRTSILSSKWRYVWASIPELNFGDTRTISNIEKFVDTVFVLHSGPICKFNLSARKQQQHCPNAFDRWIVNLSRNGIKELRLNFFSYSENYMMHSRFFSCDQLNYVNLNDCSFIVPDQFKGFKLLHTLVLKNLHITEGEIEKLISGCPLLKKLKIEYFLASFYCLNIHAPSLLSLEVRGILKDLQLCAPKLLFLCLDLELEYEDQDDMSESLERVLGNLPKLESLELKGFHLGYLGGGPLREGFSVTFNHLKNLQVTWFFESEKEDVFSLALFQGAPNLQSLHIDVHWTDERPISKFWEAVDRKENLFKHLQTVKIDYLTVSNTILEFVKFILDSATQLLTLTIEEDPGFKEDDKSETIILKQLLVLRRASQMQKLYLNRSEHCFVII